jgi:adenylate kinase
VATRLEVYDRQTVPIIDFYANLGKLVVVDGVGAGDEVQERLVKEIDGRFDPTRR